MKKLIVEGGRPLHGAIQVQGAKNAALPILAASLLADGTHHLFNVPKLTDIDVMLDILRSLGCTATQHAGKIELDTTSMYSSHVPEQLMRRMRSSIFLLGPLLARFGEVRIYSPGGCAIGERKIDLHLKGLQALGAEIEQSGGSICCKAQRLRGTEIMLDYPSVGATENLLMAACVAEGRTIITNAAREPEIVDLQRFLNAMGAKIVGAGTDTIDIVGVERLEPAASYTVMPDRIVAGTWMMAAAVTRGHLTLHGVNPSHLTAVSHFLRRIGVEISTRDDIMDVTFHRRPQAIDRIVTAPYPAFPTDLQSQAMVLLALADGLSVVKETVFEGRFKHVDELCRMGADIRVDLNLAFIRGVRRLYGATVEATDLRAGAALVLAGLAAMGTTVIENIEHIDRGYEQIERVLQSAGASVYRVETPD